MEGADTQLYDCCLLEMLKISPQDITQKYHWFRCEFYQMGSYPKHRCLQAGRQISTVAKAAAMAVMANRQIRRGCMAFFTYALRYFKRL